jgi:hypothetical protein
VGKTSRAQPTLDERVEKELAFWRESETERSGVFSPELVVWKLTEANSFLEAMRRHRLEFERANDVLELGAGQGWAS